MAGTIEVHANGDQFLNGKLIATGIPNERGLRRLVNALAEFAWKKEEERLLALTPIPAFPQIAGERNLGEGESAVQEARA